MDIRRESFLNPEIFVIRPGEILGSEQDDYSEPIYSPSSTDGMSPRKDWSLFKYIPRTMRKFGDSLRSLSVSHSEDEQVRSKHRKEYSFSDTDTTGFDRDHHISDRDRTGTGGKNRRKVVQANFASRSQDEATFRRNAKPESRMPRRAKSHPIPGKSSMAQKKKFRRDSNGNAKMKVGFSQAPDIKVSGAEKTPPATSSVGVGMGPPDSPPPRKHGRFFHHDEPYAKCKNCKKFLHELKKAFKQVRTRREKYQLLTSVPPRAISDGEVMAREFGCSEALAYSALALRSSQGAFSAPLPTFIQHIPEYVKSSIIQFFLEVENSGSMRTRGDPFYFGEFFATGNLEARKRKAMFVSLSELFHEYYYVHFDHRRSLSISRFAYFIPRTVVWSKPFRGDSFDCCMVHENMQLMLQACTTYYAEAIGKMLNIVVCNTNSPHCMLGFCGTCPLPGSVNMLSFDCCADEDIEYHIWQRDVEYGDEWIGNSPPMTLAHLTEPAPVFIGKLNRMIFGDFLIHHFIYNMQKEYLQHMNSFLCLEQNVVLVKMDFCEPYTALTKIGPMKSNLVDFNPRNNIAIHPFCIKFYDTNKGSIETRFVVVISNILREDATSSYIFRAEMVKWLRHTLPLIKKVVYFSDDNEGHFKNSEMILNLLYHEEDFKLKADHEFTVEGHENQECIGVVTQIKRKCRMASISGEAEIGTAEEMFQFCRSELSRYDLQFAYVNGNVGRIKNLEGKLSMRYKVNDGIIPGIKRYYSFRPDFGNDGRKDVVHMRRVSLSKHEVQVRIRFSTGLKPGKDLAGASASSGKKGCEMQWLHEVTQFHPEEELGFGRRVRRSTVDPSQLMRKNTVTVNLEGVIYRGVIEDHDRVMLGDLLVSLTGKVEVVRKDKKKRRKSQKEIFVNWKYEKPVWISTLDVISVVPAIFEEGFVEEFTTNLRRLSLIPVVGRNKERWEDGDGTLIGQKKKMFQARSSSLSPNRILVKLRGKSSNSAAGK